jgi:gliding motility-associated-like protein
LNITLKEGEEYKVCPDSSNIGNKIASFKSTCETNDAFSVAFKGNCALLKGIAASTITSACALIACNNNQCDTTKLLIKVIPQSATAGSSRTIDYTIPEGDELNWCLTDTTAANPLVSFKNACERDGNVFTKITLNTATRCVNVKGVRLGVGDKACIVACDKKGKCDTTYLILKVDKKATVTPSTTKIETFTLIEGEMKNWCLDTTKYTAAMLPLKSFVNSCPTSSGKLVTPTLMATKRCVAVKGNIAGTGEKICLVACTKTGTCDTTILNVTVQKKSIPTGSKIKIIHQTVAKNKKGTYTIDTTALAGTKINSVRLEACKRKFGEFVSFSLSPNERSVIYDGRDIGSDTACIFVKNDKGIVDTTYLYVKVIENVVIKSTIKRDTVMVGKTKEYCIDTTKYGGAIDRTTFKNICAKSSGKNANITTIPNRLCVSYKGLTVGTDTACIVLCSKTAACDTTKLIVTTIVNPNPPPVAASDSVGTKQDSAIVLKIANNDLVFGRTYSLKIIKPTLRGKAVVSGGNIEYVPDRGFCGAKDKLTYEICTTNGCDTASVVINVQCRSVNASGELKVNNGISPNGDGSNDVFTIEGLEKYPNNRVSIFNRWGASVFEKTNYQSDWGGTWNNTYLPDGTYFYILDDGGGKVLKKGYIQIQR